MNSQERAERFELLYAAYIAKLRRLDELVARGRYGYQLRMPKRALSIAIDNLRAFGREHEVEVDSLFYDNH
jgi:hypothetical protein